MSAPSDEPPSRGVNLPLSLPRRMVCDLLHFAHRIPTVPVQRVVDVSRLIELRERAGVHVGWVAVFLKAFAVVAAERPELRRAYLPYPRPRLYQHPFSVASVAVEREYGGEHGVFYARIPRPEALGLVELDAVLKRFKTAPVEEVYDFLFRFYSLPRPVRRLIWWYVLNLRGSRKAEFMGTFAVTVYSALGAESLHPLSPLTSTLNYGVIGADGRVPVRVVYDHRVMDGATVARALARLDEVLNGEVADELAALG
jgi:hypothetical protein